MSTDDKLMKTLARALGQHWQDAWKIDEVASAAVSVNPSRDSGQGELDADELPAPMDENALDSALDDD